MKTYKGKWENATNYPPIGCINNEWLAWEFIRRNDEYAKEVEEMVKFLETEEYSKGFKLNSESILDGVVCYPQANPGETAKQFYKRTKLEKIKRRRIEKPANTFANKWGLKKPVSPDTKYESGLVEFEKSHVRLKRTKEFKAENIALILHPNEIAARFRLDLPIPKQIEQAKNMLMLEASEYDERQKLLTENEKKTFVANAYTQLTQTVFDNASFWLRSFDASKLQKKKTNNPKARQELESGVGLQTEMFNNEINLLNIVKSKKKIALLKPTKVKAFVGMAEDYIYGKKFQKLLYVESNPIQVKKTAKKNELFNWPTPFKSDNESSSL